MSTSTTSSNASMRTLVNDALACVAVECPHAYRAMQTALGARRVSLVVGEESLEIALTANPASRSSHFRARAACGPPPALSSHFRARAACGPPPARESNPEHKSADATDDTIVIEATSRILHDVLVGERDPLDAILADDIVMHGGADDLVALGEAGLFFVKGAVRCTSMQPLLLRLRQMSHGGDVSLLKRGESDGDGG